MTIYALRGRSRSLYCDFRRLGGGCRIYQQGLRCWAADGFGFRRLGFYGYRGLGFLAWRQDACARWARTRWRREAKTSKYTKKQIGVVLFEPQPRESRNSRFEVSLQCFFLAASADLEFEGFGGFLRLGTSGSLNKRAKSRGILPLSL